MKRKFLISASFGLLGLAAPLQASGDYGCDQDWRLESGSFSCGSSVVISPGNDSRVNLALLLRDRAGLAAKPMAYAPENPDWDEGFGRNFFDWGTLRDALYPSQITKWDEAQSESYESSCDTRFSGNDAFAQALASNKGISASERAPLAMARKELAGICKGPQWVEARNEGEDGQYIPFIPKWPMGITSTAGREYLGYIKASAAFYEDKWDTARQGYAALSASSDSWLRETALYMVARTDLRIAADKAFDNWGDFQSKAVDTGLVDHAMRGLQTYTKAYPAGLYTASANGLMRRAYWLKGDKAAMAEEYAAVLGSIAPADISAADLVNEVDGKLLMSGDITKELKNPLLLASFDLLRMRARGAWAPIEGTYEDEYETSANQLPELTRAEIDAQSAWFRERPDLHSFIKANHAFYVAGTPREVLSLIPDAARADSYSAIDFSRQALRGLALAALKDPNEEGFWLDLIKGAKGIYQRPAVELALAQLYERKGQVAKVFAAGSLIQETRLRRILLQHSAGADVLRQQGRDTTRPAGERNVALLTLLYKQLMTGRYADFTRDVALVPASAPTVSDSWGLWGLDWRDDAPAGMFTRGKFSDGFACGKVSATALALAANPKDPKALLCLGDFYRLQGFDNFSLFDGRPAADELGGGAEPFTGQVMVRGNIYRQIIANKAAPANARAYALYRAVRCYAPSGNNSCGDAEVEIEQRQAWFAQLKREYPGSQWARKLSVYW